jgi:uncharacterized membrane protein AbrB (regulator of aidB expression)
MKAWEVLRFIVRERRIWDALALVALGAVFIGLFVLKVFEARIVAHAPNGWWFVLVVVAAAVAFLFLLQWLYKRYDL